MRRIIISLFCLVFLSVITCNSFARQSGGSGDDLKGVCELAGGTWTGSEGGNWACCWDNWGCYGCVDGNCKMKCNTQRCKKANGMARISSDNSPVSGLAPKGMKAPIVPKKMMHKHESTQTPSSEVSQ